MDPNSEFQRQMVEYLESVHQGEFMTGNLEEICLDVDNAVKVRNYHAPTHTLLYPPPSACRNKNCTGCFGCWDLGVWWYKFKHTVHDLFWHSNAHECGGRCYTDGQES